MNRASPYVRHLFRPNAPHVLAVMPKSDKKKPGKTLNDYIDDAHEGDYIPSEGDHNKTSAQKPAGAAKGSQDSKEKRKKYNKPSNSKDGSKSTGNNKDFDPTGHEGGYIPSET
ncbi:MAG: hypothetical protein Q9219_006080 [cf. Caloplaca sp. 3 TL-2023]